MLISVIIPCYNASLTIHRAIDSVITQTYDNWEIILVDNNSTDNTLHILENYQRKFPKKIIVLKEHKKGAPAARNKGLFTSNGEWVQFLDSDDEIIMDKFERMLKIIQQHKDIHMICCQSLYISEMKEEVRLVEDDIWLGLIKSKLGNTCANFFNKDKLLQIQGWNEAKTSSQEFDLMFRLLKNNANTYINNEITAIIYSSNSQSISRDKSPKKVVQILDNSIDLRLQIRKYLIKQNNFDRVKKAATSKFIRNNLIYFLPFSKIKILQKTFKLLPILNIKDICIILYLMPNSLIRKGR